MSRFKVATIAALVLALVIVGAVWYAASAAASNANAPYPPLHAHHFQVSDTYVPGDPAINPRLSQTGTGPAFTQDDVVAYLNTNGFFAGPVVSGAHLKILTVKFVTSKQASDLMSGESVGRPDDALVCYVKVQGPFLLTNVSVPRGAKAQTTAEYGDAVFDAHTGNLLVWGVYFN
jgi:hypothetical protein